MQAPIAKNAASDRPQAARRRFAPAASQPYDLHVQRVIDTVGGVWELFLLACRTRFKLRGSYWRWRYETAFGTDPSRMPPRIERYRAMLDYGRWVYRTKRGR